MRIPSLILKKTTCGLLIWLCFIRCSSFCEAVVTPEEKSQILDDNALSDGDKAPKDKLSEEMQYQTNVDRPATVEVTETLESILEQSASSQNTDDKDFPLIEESSSKISKTESDLIEQADQPSLRNDDQQPISPDDGIPRVHQLKDQEEGGAVDQAEVLSEETRTNTTSEDQAADISVEKFEETNETFAHNIMAAEGISEDSVKQEETNVQPQSDQSNKLEVAPLSILPSADDAESTLSSIKEDSPPLKPSLEPVEDMPSFDEWKKKMLAEQEKSKQNDQIGHNNTPVPSKIKQQSKNRNNYASIDCGAKILAINSEAQSASSILIENRDEYMLNPCRAKIWFIVELCEPIQLKLFEIANFELFSSTPKTFRAYSSDRYPTRDWTLLNTFHARDERAVQQFSLNEQIFIKYFKIEMLSHFGSEHYCPLSLLRVYGTSMVEEYEDSQSDHHTPDTYNEDLDVDDLERDKNEVPKNLFGSAKDAVLSIVKKAASALTGEKQAHVAKGNESSNGNLTEEEVEEKSSKVEVPSKEKKKSVCEQSANLGSTLYYPHTPGAAIPTCQPGAGTKSADKNLSVTSSIRSVTSRSARSLLEDCTLCEPIQNVTENHTVYDLWSTCTYMKTLLSVTLNLSNCCPSGKSYPRPHYPMDSVCTIKATESICNFDDVLPTRMPNYVPTGTQDTSIGQYMTASTSMNVQIPTYSKTIDNSYVKKSSCEEDLSVLTLPVHGTYQIDPTMIQPTATIKESDIKEVDTKVGLKSSEQEEILSSGSTFEEIAVGTIEEKQLSNLEIATDTVLVLETAQLGLFNASLEKELDDAILGDLLNLPDVDSSNISSSLPNIDASIPSETQQIDASNEGDVLSLSALVGGDTRSPIHGHGAPAFISSSQKESVFMRLNNRIKALELNMSLSGQYLEELSRRYRKQMEEMQRAFNKTIGALNETAKKAHQMDIKQQEVIAILEARLENLTTAVETLMEEQQTLHRQVIERHLFLMMLEVIFMLILVGYCLWKNVPHDVLNNMHKLSVPSRSTSSRKSLKRRNSNDGTIGHNSPENSSLKRRLSEDAFTGEPTPELMIVQPSIPILIEVPSKAIEGKRKKHHSKLRNKAKSAINLEQSTVSLFQQQTSRVTAAGLLFGPSIVDDASSSSGASTASSGFLDHCSSTNVSCSKTSNKQNSRSSLPASLKSNSSNKNSNRSSLESKDSSLKVQIIGSLFNGTCNGHVGGAGTSQPKKEKS